MIEKDKKELPFNKVALNQSRSKKELKDLIAAIEASIPTYPDRLHPQVSSQIHTTANISIILSFLASAHHLLRNKSLSSLAVGICTLGATLAAVFHPTPDALEYKRVNDSSWTALTLTPKDTTILKTILESVGEPLPKCTLEKTLEILHATLARMDQVPSLLKEPRFFSSADQPMQLDLSIVDLIAQYDHAIVPNEAPPSREEPRPK